MNLKVLPEHFCYYSYQSLASLLRQNFDDNAFICTIPGDYSLMVVEGSEVNEFEEVETGWRCLTIPGKWAFSKTGIAATITTSLADANISVLVMSGFKTDYFFVQSDLLDSSIRCLQEAGHQIAT